MMDFNSSSSVSGQIIALVDAGMQQARARQSERQYLGASRLGVACERALQFEYAKAPIDDGRDTPGRMLRIFERGHVMEDCMVAWLRDAGFDLRTRKADGEQFGFSVVDGRLQGHIDGVIVGGPDGFAYPALWENKCLGNKSWRELEKNRLENELSKREHELRDKKEELARLLVQYKALEAKVGKSSRVDRSAEDEGKCRATLEAEILLTENIFNAINRQ